MVNMNINWVLFGVGAVMAIGIYLLLAYADDSSLPDTIRSRYTKIRYVGYTLIIASIAFTAFAVFSNKIKFTASMPGDCETCRVYINRHRNLQPYSANEFSLLQKHSQACNTCSSKCFDEIKLLEKHQPKAPELPSKRSICGDITKHAVLARNELERLKPKLYAKQLATQKVLHDVGGEADWAKAMPPAPTHVPMKY